MVPPIRTTHNFDSLPSTQQRLTILQIIPSLPPVICGVGDHAFGLGNQLQQSHDFQVRYLAVNSSSDSCLAPENYRLQERSCGELLRVLRSQRLPKGTSLLLHFSGYSFGARGICFWLTKSLDRFLNERPDIRLVTMFHELWSPAPLLSKSGFVVPIQKAIVRRLIRLSAVVHTNRQMYGAMIRKLCPKFGGPLTVQNVFSNFGELIKLPNSTSRKRQILVFQPPDYASKSGKSFWDGWRKIRNRLGDLPTIVAGRKRSIPKDDSIRIAGFISAEEGSKLMRESRFAYLEYFDGYLGKSSIFASLASHGMVCVMPRLNHSHSDGLEHGRHYLLADDNELADENRLEFVSNEIHSWYKAHSLAATAATYAAEIATLHSADTYQ